MKVKLTAARTIPGNKQYSNMRPEASLELEAEDVADLDAHMQKLEGVLDKAEARYLAEDVGKPREDHS